MKKDLPIIHFLRVLMIWGVVFFHINERYPLYSGFYLGEYCIFGCVIISGFLTGFHCPMGAQSYHFRDSIQSWQRKCGKFYRVHLITFCSAIPLVILETLSHGGKPAEFLSQAVNAVINLSLMQSLVPLQWVYYGYNGVSWYLSMTLILYFAAPFLLYRLSKRETPEDKLRLCGYVWAAVNLMIWLLSCGLPKTFVTKILPLAHLPGFFAAIAAGMLYAKGVSFRQLQWRRFAFSWGLALGINLVKDYFMLRSRTLIMDSALFEILSIGCLMLMLTLPARNSRLVSYLSETSFEMFMVHQMVMKYVNLFLPKEVIGSVPGFVIIIGISLPLSHGLHCLTAIKHGNRTAAGK